MDGLISDTQTGFVKGRQASASILLVKEVAHSIQKRRCKGVILKLDFEKAFDMVNWDFLLDTMKVMNFDHKWCSWIKSLLESTRISVIVNGTPSKEFAPRRGLRQGDPISPLLSNLAGQVLSSMINAEARKGIFSGIKLSKASDQISHLQFADDAVIFLDGSIESARGIKHVLQCFQLLSGLRINFGKSGIFSSRNCGIDINLMADVLNCGIGSWPMSYLGMPIGISARRKVFWTPLINRMKGKLAKWKANTLNQAGRLALVKSVLDSAPIYWMNLHIFPSTVIKHLERIRREFIWGHKSEGGKQVRKLHLTAWNKICRPWSSSYQA